MIPIPSYGAATSKLIEETREKYLHGAKESVLIEVEALDVLLREELKHEQPIPLHPPCYAWPHEHRLAVATLLRGAEIKRLREELATTKSDPGAFILVKGPVPVDLLRPMPPGKIIAVQPDQRLVEENENLRAALEAIRARVVKYCPSGIPIIDKALGTQGGTS